MDHSGIERDVRSKKRPHGFRGDIPATGEGDVRMERAEIGFEPGGQGRFLDAFVQLK